MGKKQRQTNQTNLFVQTSPHCVICKTPCLHGDPLIGHVQFPQLFAYETNPSFIFKE